MLFVLYFAFTVDGKFSLSNISSLSQYGNVFVLSIAFALIATVICLIIGYPLAYFMARTNPKTQKILMVLIMLPMWCNLLIRTYALMALLDNGGLINSFLESIGLSKIPIVGSDAGVILGMVYDFLPYMVLPIYSVMAKQDKKLIEAAYDLGCPRLSAHLKVTLPLSVPGIVSGLTMVFVPSISTFYISQKLGGGTFELIGDTIERQFVSGALNVGAAISLVMMVLILISLTVMNKFGNSDDGGIIL
jgi:spermidine/putrescine transport system permease protein